MDNFEILDETDLLQERRLNQRPAFLLVLCILTWVGSGLSLFYNLFIWFSLSKAKELVNSQFMRNGPNNEDYYNYFNVLIWQSIAAIFACIICTVGAVFMFKLKKVGFFTYLVGQLLVLGFIVFSFFAIPKGGSNFAAFSGINLGLNVVYAIFPIAFIVMYGLNLKHMK